MDEQPYKERRMQMPGVWGVVTQGIVIIIAVVVGLWIKDFLPSYFKKKAENLATKEDIEEITKSMETVRAAVQRLETEHQIRFEALHERRAQVVEQMYKDIVAVEEALRARAISLDDSDFSDNFPHPTDAQREFLSEYKRRAAEGLRQAVAAFRQNLAENRIYFYGDILSKLDLLEANIRLANLGLSVVCMEDEKLDQVNLDMLKSAQDTISEKIPPAKKAIEDEFRVLLGVKQADA